MSPAFHLYGVGRVARNPEVVTRGSVKYVSFCLVGGPFVVTRRETTPARRVLPVWFVAFSPLSEAILASVGKGDRVAIIARLELGGFDSHGRSIQGKLCFAVEHFNLLPKHDVSG